MVLELANLMEPTYMEGNQELCWVERHGCECVCVTCAKLKRCSCILSVGAGEKWVCAGNASDDGMCGRAGAWTH